MAGEAAPDILGLKARAAQKAFEARGMSPAKALRRAMARTADVLWDLALVVHGVGVETLDQDGVLDGLADDQLLLVLDGPDGAMGLAAVGRKVLAGLTEVQTFQQVLETPVEERRLTATDAAMAAPLLDGCLARFADNLGDHPQRDQLQGFGFGAMVEDKRMVSLMLDAAAYQAFHADVDLALGRRRGTVSLYFPETPAPVEEGASGRHGPGPHADTLEQVPIKLDVVMARVTLPLHRVEKLRSGDLMPITNLDLSNTMLLAGGRRVVARGRLGQLNGQRALRLSEPRRDKAEAAPSPRPAAASGESAVAASDVAPVPEPDPAVAAPAVQSGKATDVTQADDGAAPLPVTPQAQGQTPVDDINFDDLDNIQVD